MRLIFFFLLTISNLVFSQSKEAMQAYLINNEKAFIGKINNGTPISVNIIKAEALDNNINEFAVSGTSDVEGTVCNFNGKLTLESQSDNPKLATLFYKFEFQEEKLHEHTGIFTGSLAMKTLTDTLALVVFEGTWESYNKRMRFPVFFDNNEFLKTKLQEIAK